MAILHKEYAKPGNSIKPDYLDQVIRRLIQQNNSEDFHKVLSGEDRFEVFSQLSELRTSLINWYEFKQGAQVLEIGGEFGALTGTLCDKSSHVTVVESNLFRAEAINERYKNRDNLDIYVGSAEDIDFSYKFDYIILIGILEKQGNGSQNKEVYTSYINKIKKYLKPDGKILIAVTNRYGLRSFCGAPDPHTGRPFDSINRYQRGTTGYTFSRQELIDILDESGITKHKFYYPLPDYKLTQLVYTDEYLPEKNLLERHIPYYVKSDTLIAVEQDLYDDLVDNHVFPFFSNSFFVEGSAKDEFCSVIYAAISTDRGKNKGFTTTIHDNNTVKKQIIYPEGKEYLKQIYDNIQDLLQHGIPVIPHELQKNSFVMPYIKGKTLSIYLRELIRVDTKSFENIFDRIYDYILASSEHVAASENVLMTDSTKHLDWGIILRKAYLELIPLNCFYVEGQLLFYDQEFVKDNYPAKFIMFRALHYMYGFAPYAEAIFPLWKLMDKYGLKQLWEIFGKEEEKFLAEVRRHDLYNQFYRWSRIDRNRIADNAGVLLYKGESLSYYQETPWLKKIQAVQLDLLMALKDVCDKKHLHYYMFYGTLLGAARHNGFIPWDDDIDIVLPRKDYDRLIQLAPKEFQHPYFLQTPENDEDCFYGGYSKLRNSESTGIELINWGHQCNHGIWIDIFPLDAYYSDVKMNKQKLKKICFYQRLLYAKTYSSSRKFKDMDTKKWKYYRIVAGLYSRKLLCERLDNALKMGNENLTEYLGVFAHYTAGQGCHKLLREDFIGYEMMDFEYAKLPAPLGYKHCLEITMGINYMRYPNIGDRNPHHKAFYAPNVPYKDYVKRFMQTFQDTEGKTIVLFGAGLMFEDYMDKYGKTHRPEFLVDNNQIIWGTTKQGISIKSPSTLLEVDKDKLHLIICNIYYRQIEIQIRKMGITDYYIYVQEKEWLADDPPQNNIK